MNAATEHKPSLRRGPQTLLGGAPKPTLQVSPSTALERWLLGRMLRAIHLDWLRVTLWDDAVVQPGTDAAPAVNILSREALVGLLRNPSIGFGGAFSSGSITIEGELSDLLERLFRSCSSASTNLLPQMWSIIEGRRSRNSRDQSRYNIHSHYDLGNDFYALWLDERMVYTCAYYRHPNASLDAAQLAKLDHVCRKLRLSPGERVLELGCGWGALAIHMAEHFGVRVRAYNISSAQIEFARRTARTRGLEAKVEFVEDDYRNASGAFDRVVSVGMLEHVGTDNYHELGGVIDRCLSRTGVGLIHTIGRNAPRRMDAWIEKRIFPGGHPPTLREMTAIFSPYCLDIMDVENLRLHYAKTCQQWLARFDAQSDQVSKMFDADFVRAWRLYLAGSAAAFATGTLQLFQVLFARPDESTLPRTREYMYTADS